VFSGRCDFFLWDYVQEEEFVPPLPLDIDALELRITAAVETVEYGMSWITHWTFVGPRMEPALSIKL
jgi:hypothetical protein